MFRCETCGKVSKPYEKPRKVTVETRKKEYTSLTKYGEVQFLAEGEEIVIEKTVCAECGE